MVQGNPHIPFIQNKSEEKKKTPKRPAIKRWGEEDLSLMDPTLCAAQSRPWEQAWLLTAASDDGVTT